MIERIVIEYLIKTLNIPTYAEKPNKNPNEYIVIKNIDSGRSNQIDAVTFSIMSYAQTLDKALELNTRVKNAMYDIVSLENVSSCKLGGGGQRIDTQTKTYAYESIFNIYYMD